MSFVFVCSSVLVINHQASEILSIWFGSLLMLIDAFIWIFHCFFLVKIVFCWFVGRNGLRCAALCELESHGYSNNIIVVRLMYDFYGKLSNFTRMCAPRLEWIGTRHSTDLLVFILFYFCLLYSWRAIECTESDFLSNFDEIIYGDFAFISVNNMWCE